MKQVQALTQSLYAQCLCISLYSTHTELFLGTVEP